MALDWDSFPSGDSRHPCPICDKGPKDKALGVTITGTDGIARCFRCDFVETSKGHTRDGNAASKVLDDQRHVTLSDYWKTVWTNCEPIHGVARDYLLARECAIPPRDGHLRCHPALKHPNGYVGPALVALITDADTGLAISIHRTWVCSDGTKAVEPAKLLAKAHRKQGGVIRLWPDDAVTGGLGVAEGIESALSLARYFQPVWALIDAGNLAEFAAPAGIEALTIAADHDAAGLKAADACATRWLDVGREVRVIVPPTADEDFNDLARSAA